jgi:hypothetical protein
LGLAPVPAFPFVVKAQDLIPLTARSAAPAACFTRTISLDAAVLPTVILFGGPA